MGLNPVDIANSAALEKVALAKRVSAFLRDNHDEEERAAIENVARMLAQDIAVQVRETLAFELRTCRFLPYDLAAKIASDIESVACPFLASTMAFTDMQLAGLIPHLEEYAHITLSQRSDLGMQACQAILTVGTEKTAHHIVQNSQIKISEPSCSVLLKRFSGKTDLIDNLARRSDLPLSIVETIIAQVSAECRAVLTSTYKIEAPLAEEISSNSMYEAMWRQLEKASPTQVHAYVIDLKRSGRLTTDLVTDMAERGCLEFLESMLAIDAGLTLGAVREVLYTGDTKSFVALMQQAGVSKAAAQEYLRIIKTG